MPAGYSGTPLAKKLGIKDGHRVAVVHSPDELPGLLDPLPEGARLDTDDPTGADVVLAFHTSTAALRAAIRHLEAAVHPDRVLWLAWPKKTSGVETDLTRDVVREVILSTDLVDVKVAAVSDTWSGLKAVWRTERRG